MIEKTYLRRNLSSVRMSVHARTCACACTDVLACLCLCVCVGVIWLAQQFEKPTYLWQSCGCASACESLHLRVCVWCAHVCSNAWLSASVIMCVYLEQHLEKPTCVAVLKWIRIRWTDIGLAKKVLNKRKKKASDGVLQIRAWCRAWCHACVRACESVSRRKEWKNKDR